MRFNILLCISLVLFLAGCAKVPPPTPVYALMAPSHQVSYINEVKPILIKRCVVCHSCYNSPCQLKLSSWEGLERGASKEQIYNAGRLKTMEPSRLFIDAQTEEQWRDKGFYDVRQSTSQDPGHSVFYTLLDHKRLYPEVSGAYYPEASDLTCAQSKAEVDTYLRKHPNSGMPFGFPPLEQDEFNTIIGWLLQGAQGPSAAEQRAMQAPHAKDLVLIDRWEDFLNNQNPKHRMTARYLYEHLFLAHLTFETGSGQFYELVRSTTGPGQDIAIIPTVRPYDDPGTPSFYYRFRKIHSTIVHKTHMVFPLGGDRLERTVELFIAPEWPQTPFFATYDPLASANPFATFEQIPAKSRYQWLLDHAQYIIMTFIRGPVCKGQVALNVIHDHFWVMFLDPQYDLTVQYPGFLKLHKDRLRLPGEQGSDYNLLESLLSNEHYKWAVEYYTARQQFYGAHYPDGLPLASIWPGNRPEDQPLLTVFRHFDSASVHRGVSGRLPNTLWVIDYPLLERIYYALVAGFDVYGTAGHQLATRLYMDALRMEGESYFLDYLPRREREPTMTSWYQGIPEDSLHYSPVPVPTGIAYQTTDSKRELIEMIVKDHIKVDGINFDTNYLASGDVYPPFPSVYATKKDILNGFVAASAPGVSFFKHVANHNANLAWVRIKNIPNQEDAVVSIVIDRWHDNVKFLFREQMFLNSDKDRADFIPGFVGSYPNYFFVLDLHDLPDFLDIMENYDGTQTYMDRLEAYGVNRADENFWEVYDWFQERFLNSNPVEAGIVDLNRYYFQASP